MFQSGLFPSGNRHQSFNNPENSVVSPVHSFPPREEGENSEEEGMGGEEEKKDEKPQYTPLANIPSYPAYSSFPAFQQLTQGFPIFRWIFSFIFLTNISQA